MDSPVEKSNVKKLNVQALKVLFDVLSDEDKDQFRDLIKKPEIDLLTASNILCSYVYQTFSIDHFVYQGKKYYKWETCWGGGGTQVICDGCDGCRLVCSTCSVNFRCDKCTHEDCKFSDSEDDECEYDSVCKHFICEHVKQIIPEEEVVYIMKRDEDNMGNVEEDHEGKFYEFMNKHGDKIKIIATRETKLLDTLTIENESGINPDHRGATHCKLDKDSLYEEHVEISLPCTILQFAQALFRIKSHKWDMWYELYSVCDYDDGTLSVGFDHGS